MERNYLESRAYIQESEMIIGDLTKLIEEYKNEEHILSGETISTEEWRSTEQIYFHDSFQPSRRYNPNLQ